MTVFVAGVHGVGKSFLCQQYAEHFSVLHESASSLIRKERAQMSWSLDKKTSDINSNQVALKSAVQKVIMAGKKLLLDGHFVLIDSGSKFVSLDLTVFKDIGLSGVVLLEAEGSVILSRLATRDSSVVPVDVDLFLKHEREQAQYVCDELNIPIFILSEPSFPRFSEAVGSLFEFES